MIPQENRRAKSLRCAAKAIVACCLISYPLAATADSHGQFNNKGTRQDFKKMASLVAKASDLVRHGDIDSAITIFKEAIVFYPKDAVPHHSLAMCLFMKGDYNGALTEENQATAIEPDWAEAWRALGSIYEQSKKLPDAERCCRKSIALDSHNFGALAQLGDVLREQGKFSEARTIYLKAKALDPNDSARAKSVDTWLRLCDQHNTKPAMVKPHPMMTHVK
jgi:Flp pilus assembly protein TadD